MDFQQLSGAPLAYIDDAVYEVLVRRRLLERGLTRSKDLNGEARSFVTAVAQSAALERILPLLDEEETEIYKRGRNAHGISAPKSADAGEYRRATGLEALFGALYLSGREERAKELFDVMFPEGTPHKEN